MKVKPPSALRPGNLHPVRALVVSCRGAGKGLHFGEHQAHRLLRHPEGEAWAEPGGRGEDGAAAQRHTRPLPLDSPLS